MSVVDDDPSRLWTEPGVYRVTHGVYRVPLPMPNDGLRAVNVYAMTSERGVTFIDSGVADPAARRSLQVALDGLGYGLKDVRRFLVTHLHYDHYAQGLALQRQLEIPVHLGRAEEPSLQVLDRVDDGLAAQYVLLRRYGAPDVAHDIEQERADRRAGSPISGYPAAWLDHNTIIQAEERELRVIHTPGHTRGHVVFADELNGSLFAGDHVLPHITPSIGYEPSPPELPLRDYLRSLAAVRERPDTMLLPAHGPIAESVHERVDALLKHHEVRLIAAAKAVSFEPSTAAQAAGRLIWTRRNMELDELDQLNRMLAILETGAHLDLLAAQSRVSRDETDGVTYYES